MFALSSRMIYKFFSILLLLCAGNSYAGDYSYPVTQDAFPNPERGWYAYTLMLDNNDYASLANQGYRLVYSPIVLRDFMNSDIDTSTLNTITNRFAAMRNAGIKAVLRVNYNEEDGGLNPDFPQMERHMKQLAPIIEANKDVIAYIEAGYMGPWGEWHFWNVNNPPFPDKAASWKTLMNLLLANNPEDRFIMIRYPSKKQEIFAGRTITEQTAFSGVDEARVGHHNDCFVSSSDDVGTYQPDQTSYSSSIADLKAFLKADTRFSPIGGETCDVHARGSCSTTLTEMTDFHWTYLNGEYHPQVISGWKNGGCYDEIDRRLGYRLELLQASLPDTITTGGSNTLTLQIHNSGFARPWYYRTPYIRLIQNGIVVAEIAVPELDIRNIEPGATDSVTLNFITPAYLSGSVDVALWLPDVNEDNHNDSRYSIRLANDNTWNSSLGHNLLATNIPVGLAAPRAPEITDIRMNIRN